MKDVERFFNTKHRDHYLIINLCSEKKYSNSHFYGQIKEFPFNDHQPPSFPLIHQFCLCIEQWFSLNPQNVVGVHCKAGKGRTGTMISCVLQYLKYCQSAEEALRFFSLSRTSNKAGVTIPSQIRYVQYYEQYLNNGQIYQPKEVRIKQISLDPCPHYNRNGGCDLFLKILWNDQVYKTKEQKYQQNVQIDLLDMNVSGDVQILFYQSGITDKLIFQLWFNTAFVQLPNTLAFSKNELDHAIKDKDCKHFDFNFLCSLKIDKPKEVRKRSCLIFEAPKFHSDKVIPSDEFNFVEEQEQFKQYRSQFEDMNEQNEFC